MWNLRLPKPFQSLTFGSNQARRGGPRPRRAARLGFERLETRDVPAVVFVTSGDDAGPGTLRAAIEAVNADAGAGEIHVQVNQITLETELPHILAAAVTADNGHCTISPAAGAGDFTLLTFEFEPSSVTGFVFAGGHSAGDAGAVRAHGITIDDSFFYGNTAAENGGAVNAVKATITNSVFAGNVSGGKGGAVYLAGGGLGTSTIADSVFQGNTAWSDGGALFSSSQGYLLVSDSVFTNNYAEGYGGGIYASAPAVLMTGNMEVAFNTGVYGGDGVYIVGAEVVFLEGEMGMNANEDVVIYTSRVDADLTIWCNGYVQIFPFGG